MAQPVYLVIKSVACDDDYYPDYDRVYCVCSTKEKAEEIVGKLLEKYKDSDPWVFTDARVVEYGLDAIPDLDGSV
jgi:hypothetical protein